MVLKLSLSVSTGLALIGKVIGVSYTSSGDGCMQPLQINATNININPTTYFDIVSSELITDESRKRVWLNHNSIIV
ncbi:MAG TPA: hypothetical protein PLK02_06585 [Paludibacteraceae bacterium]|nr:hypothetical protein [Paludibacteraceae bacterium]